MECLASEGEPGDDDVEEDDTDSDGSIVESLGIDGSNCWKAEDDGDKCDIDDAYIGDRSGRVSTGCQRA